MVDATSGAIRQLRHEERAGFTGDGLEVAIAAVPAFDGLAIPVNLYLPKEDAGVRRPTTVLVHGGAAASAQVR